MTSLAKKIFFVLSGLAIIATIFVVTKSNAVSEPKEHGKTFSDWSVSCSKEKDTQDAPTICTLNQQVDITKDDKKQPIALFRIGYFGPAKELKLVQILPLGVNLSAGTSVISSKNLIMPGQFTTCLADGCSAVATITDADLKLLLSNQDNAVAFMNLEGKQITLPLSTKGLEQALNYMK